MYTVRIVWCRRPAVGVCYIILERDEDRCKLIGKKIWAASKGPYKIKTGSSSTELVINGIDENLISNDILEPISKLLDMTQAQTNEHLSVIVPHVNVPYRRDEKERIEREIIREICKSVEQDRFEIKLRDFTEKTARCTAFARFQDIDDCEAAVDRLTCHGITRGYYIGKVDANLYETVSISATDFLLLKSYIDYYIMEINARFKPTPLTIRELESGDFRITILTNTVYRLGRMESYMYTIIEGDVIEVGEEKDFIFSEEAKVKVNEIEEQADVKIAVDSEQRNLRIRGLKKNRKRARALVKQWIENEN